MDRLRLIGIIELVVRDKDGKVKERRVLKNVITDVGKAQVAGLINGIVTTPFQYIAIGTGTAPPSSTDTALGNEVMRGLGDVSRETTNVANDTAVVTTTFTFTASYSITESGLFDASTGGNMLARQTFSAINVQSGDTLTITWKVQVS